MRGSTYWLSWARGLENSLAKGGARNGTTGQPERTDYAPAGGTHPPRGPRLSLRGCRLRSLAGLSRATVLAGRALPPVGPQPPGDSDRRHRLESVAGAHSSHDRGRIVRGSA